MLKKNKISTSETARQGMAEQNPGSLELIDCVDAFSCRLTKLCKAATSPNLDLTVSQPDFLNVKYGILMANSSGWFLVSC